MATWFGIIAQAVVAVFGGVMILWFKRSSAALDRRYGTGGDRK